MLNGGVGFFVAVILKGRKKEEKKTMFPVESCPRACPLVVLTPACRLPFADDDDDDDDVSHVHHHLLLPSIYMGTMARPRVLVLSAYLSRYYYPSVGCSARGRRRQQQQQLLDALDLVG